MLKIILAILVLGILGYAIVTQWQNTDPSQSIPKRTWAALLAAAATFGAFVMSFFQQTGGTP